eukprot:RCo016653
MFHEYGARGSKRLVCRVVICSRSRETTVFAEESSVRSRSLSERSSSTLPTETESSEATSDDVPLPGGGVKTSQRGEPLVRCQKLHKSTSRILPPNTKTRPSRATAQASQRLLHIALGSIVNVLLLGSNSLPGRFEPAAVCPPIQENSAVIMGGATGTEPRGAHRPGKNREGFAAGFKHFATGVGRAAVVPTKHKNPVSQGDRAGTPALDGHLTLQHSERVGSGTEHFAAGEGSVAVMPSEQKNLVSTGGRTGAVAPAAHRVGEHREGVVAGIEDFAGGVGFKVVSPKNKNSSSMSDGTGAGASVAEFCVE